MDPQPATESIEYSIRRQPLKRCFDLLFSSLGLFILAPLMLAVAAAVKWSRWSSPGPIFFAQSRIGRGNKPFLCYKFRTMHEDAERQLDRLLALNPSLRQEWRAQQKLKNDPRVTRLGRLLRITCLDELPQLWNVLRGDLSIVGPRPLVESEVRQRLGKRAAKILSVRPGLTGLWQTSGRSDTSYRRRISMDLAYVDRQSFWLDLQLIFRTIPVMLFRRGAY